MVAHRPDILARLAEKGARLREVRASLLRQTPGTTQRWFQGPDGCDLFLWYDAGKGLTQLQLTLEHRAVEWSREGGVNTARLASFNPLTPHDDQARLLPDRVPDEETLELARALLSRASVDDVTLALVQQALGLRRAGRP